MTPITASLSGKTAEYRSYAVLSVTGDAAKSKNMPEAAFIYKI
jgi:hypothetical protein